MVPRAGLEATGVQKTPFPCVEMKAGFIKLSNCDNSDVYKGEVLFISRPGHRLS